MALDMKDYNALGSAINSTYARSSQSVKNQTYNVNATLHSDSMTVTALTVVNLIDHRHMEQEVKKCEKELNQVINHYISEIKKEFKADAKKALKLKKIKNSEETTTELVGYYSPHSPVRSAYVRRKMVFEVG